MHEKWTAEDYKALQAALFALADEKYRLFHERLLRSALPVIGIRAPILRQKAKEVAKAAGKNFFPYCEKGTHEERLLYGLVAAALPMKFEDFLRYCDSYAYEFVENWAQCDMFCASLKKIANQNQQALFAHAKGYLSSENPWAVRVGLIIMLNYYLKPPYLPEVLQLTDGVHSDFYYIQMAQAWLLATAWAKDAEAVGEYCNHCGLSYEVKSKFVQKTCESFRVSPEDKAWLRAWKKAQKAGEGV